MKDFHDLHKDYYASQKSKIETCFNFKNSSTVCNAMQYKWPIAKKRGTSKLFKQK